MSGNPIGILDSGIGGLTIAKEIALLLPQESIVYIGDSANAPYGKLRSEEMYELSRKMVQFLVQKKAKLIVIGCNTITVKHIEKLREEFGNIPIIGTVPVVKKAAEITKNKRIGILSTSQTAKSKYQENLIATFAADCEVFVHGTDELVPLIEKGIFSGEEIDHVLKNELQKFKKEKIDTLALGCTHFPLVQKSIKKQIEEKVQLLDSGSAIARQVKRILESNSLEKDFGEASYVLYTTGEPTYMNQTLKEIQFSPNSSVSSTAL